MILRFVAAVVCCLILFSGGRAGFADVRGPVSPNSAASDRSDMSISLFGCIMPLPPRYILRAQSRTASSSIGMFRLDPPGDITILRFEPIDTSTMEILSEKRIGFLTAITVRLRKELLPSSPTLSIIHDGSSSLAITGPDEDWIGPMARACAENPLPR